MRAKEFTKILVESKLSYVGNCTDDDVIEHIFGDATRFAQLVDEHGDDFELDDLVVKYDPESDVHSFYYKQQDVTEARIDEFYDEKANKPDGGKLDRLVRRSLANKIPVFVLFDNKPTKSGYVQAEHPVKGFLVIGSGRKTYTTFNDETQKATKDGNRVYIQPRSMWNASRELDLDEGVAEDTVDEMALSTYKTMGDFSKPGPFTGADKKLVPHPKNIEKATRFFERTPFDFRLFFSHLKGTGKYSEHGPMSPDQIRKVFGQDAEEIINGSEDAITVVYVGNKGDAKVMLTPWMMAHRFGHAIAAGDRYNNNWHAWREAEKYFFQTVNSLLEEHYGKVDSGSSYYMGRPKTDQLNFNLTQEYNALFNSIGTQRSSTTGQIRRPYEFLYELFAQYLGTGNVTLNPLPTNLGYGRKAWGTPTKYMNIKPEYRDELSRKTESDKLAHTMEYLFYDVLSDSVGKIFVM